MVKQLVNFGAECLRLTREEWSEERREQSEASQDRFTDHLCNLRDMAFVWTRFGFTDRQRASAYQLVVEKIVELDNSYHEMVMGHCRFMTLMVDTEYGVCVGRNYITEFVKEMTKLLEKNTVAIPLHLYEDKMCILGQIWDPDGFLNEVYTEEDEAEKNPFIKAFGEVFGKHEEEIERRIIHEEREREIENQLIEDHDMEDFEWRCERNNWDNEIVIRDRLGHNIVPVFYDNNDI